MINEIFSHIHPIVVHFPIVIITLTAVYDLLYAIFRRKASPRGHWFWLLAFLSAWLAIGTGPGEDARGNTNIFHYHDTWATITTWLALIVTIFRFFFVMKRKELIQLWLVISCILSIVCAVGILTVGYIGGKMVYDQGIGVKMDGKYVNPPKHDSRQ
ncbi:DUF2231 domain-containing protein [Bacillus sp. FJAT-49736]|uniref:DUF2231 domain-containing protein n=1 Tax=Bacillus sp. FJAT-49736 TaxID=2833582 RepID=UPI001BC921B0|nr:DUF2231 domain-containing protein [Bacillus sp. FJAT-49736]MBS4172259.1 hypothetical protein [Bacillus sp. FJAT-49736]